MAASEATTAGARPIACLRPSDAADLCPLSIEAGWNQVAADWHLMLTLGRGYGVRGADGRWIASALALPVGPDIRWLSMVLVSPPMRGQGLGRRLLAHCLAEVEASGGAAGLDATELGRPVYLPLGFRDLYPLSRWHARNAVRQAFPPPVGIDIRPARAEDLKPICAYDAPRSGLARAPILSHLLRRAGGLARIAQRRDGTLAGFSLARDGHRTMHVGPIVAEDEALGLALLSHALAASDAGVIADIPDRHARIGRWLVQQGASSPRGFVRMLRGRASLDDAAHTFALAGPELA